MATQFKDGDDVLIKAKIQRVVNRGSFQEVYLEAGSHVFTLTNDVLVFNSGQLDKPQVVPPPPTPVKPVQPPQPVVSTK